MNMTSMDAARAAGRRKMATQMLIGGFVGGIGAFAAMRFLRDRPDGIWDASHVTLLGIGLVYAILGLFVAIGALVPGRVGARFLNVSDAEELDEERPNMIASAVGCLAIGAALVLLAWSSADGDAAPLSGGAVLAILAAALAIFLGASIATWRRLDELWRRLIDETSAITGNILLALGALWGGAAAAGYVPSPHPVDLVSAAFGSLLLASFLAAGRRGMMTPR